MTIKNKIRKRIKTWNMISKEPVEQIEITEEEAIQLRNIKEIDGVRLITVKNLENFGEKKDCFAYQENKCYALDGMFCGNCKCKFYRNDITIDDIEKSIKYYSLSIKN